MVCIHVYWRPRQWQDPSCWPFRKVQHRLTELLLGSINREIMFTQGLRVVLWNYLTLWLGSGPYLRGCDPLALKLTIHPKQQEAWIVRTLIIEHKEFMCPLSPYDWVDDCHNEGQYAALQAPTGQTCRVPANLEGGESLETIVFLSGHSSWWAACLSQWGHLDKWRKDLERFKFPCSSLEMIKFMHYIVDPCLT